MRFLLVKVPPYYYNRQPYDELGVLRGPKVPYELIHHKLQPSSLVNLSLCL